MNTRIADDHASIKARLEEIQAERSKPIDNTQAQVDQYMSGDHINVPVSEMPYLGWDIYAPVCATTAYDPPDDYMG